MLDYDPDGTVGTTTHSASMGITAGTSGISFNASLSWQYSLSDIVVHNYSNAYYNDFHLCYEFSKNSASETRRIAPGYMVAVDCDNGYFKEGDYIGSEYYTITFKNNHNQTSTFNITLSPYIKANPCTLTYNGNRADDNIENGDRINLGIDHIGETFSIDYAQGAHVKLYDVGYIRSGYTIAGFSYNSSSTSPEYVIGDVIKLVSNQTLYIIWQQEE